MPQRKRAGEQDDFLENLDAAVASLNPYVKKLEALKYESATEGSDPPVADFPCWECGNYGVSIWEDFYKFGHCCYCGSDNEVEQCLGCGCYFNGDGGRNRLCENCIEKVEKEQSMRMLARCNKMRNDTFIEFLRYIKLPCGTLLPDETTYRLGKKDFPSCKFREELESFEKILVLSDGKNNVVGGVVFYGSVDIQATILPKYRNHGYMSAISKNGILKSECYDGQQVSIVTRELYNMDDFLLRYHLLQVAGLRVKNLKEIYKHLDFFRAVSMGEDEFINKYS